MARVIIEQAGEDVFVGGDFTGTFGDGGDINVIGTRTGGEEITVIEGDIILDSSFNAGGDVISLPGEADDYTAELVGSRVILTNIGSEVLISIPVGEEPNTIIFGGDDSRAIEIEGGQVFIGDQVIDQSPRLLERSGGSQLAAALSDLLKADHNPTAEASEQQVYGEAAFVAEGYSLAGFPEANFFVESQTFA